jgi:hypothetical protein
MIVFSEIPKPLAGLRLLTESIKRKNKKLHKQLDRVLYVLSAANTRHADIFISPQIEGSTQLATEIASKFPAWSVSVESIGNPPQTRWIAFTPRAREASLIQCSKICIFAEHFINDNVIIRR